MPYRLGVDVGSTFTDLLLFEEDSGAFWRYKTPSTPSDSSGGILIGVEAICAQAGISPVDVEIFLHGATGATNAVLEGKGARVGLIVIEGYRHIMQIARSFVPGGLAGWIVWPKPQPPVFDFGPPIELLRERCLAETGLPAPRQPVWDHAQEARA